ncbi:MAG: hypothetical protein R3C17_19930 [Planctomycetaceae bacterium]
MVAQLNPYDAPPAGPQVELSLRSKIFAGAVGCFVLTGSAITMGIVLIAVLILNAGRTQPTPIQDSKLLDAPSQKTILFLGAPLIVLVSFTLAGWVIFRILKSQQRTAEAQFRRIELQDAVLRMHSEVRAKREV